MTRKAHLIPAVALAALAVAGSSSAAANQAADPGLDLTPAAVHVKNGRIVMKATRAAEAGEASGVILGRLPLPMRRGSLLDPGSLGGPFFSMQPGQTIPVVFKLTDTTKALKTHPKTALTVTIKLLDAERNSFVSTKKITIYAR